LTRSPNGYVNKQKKNFIITFPSLTIIVFTTHITVKGSVFSDPTVIAFVNKHYVPVELDLTNEGFPSKEQLLAIQSIKNAFDNTYHCRFGFSVNVVINPMLAFPLGAANGGAERGLQFAVEYNAPLFMQYLESCLSRYKKSQLAISTNNQKMLKELHEECMGDVLSEHRYKSSSGSACSL